MAKLKFKKKCRMCKAVWIESTKPLLCEPCKRKLKKYEKESKKRGES